MARLLLALLIALLPMPAALAACHSAPSVAEAHSHHQKPASEPAKAQLPADQLCIGCVAPATVRPPAFGEPVAIVRVESRAAEIAGVARDATPPATPPPRLQA